MGNPFGSQFTRLNLRVSYQFLDVLSASLYNQVGIKVGSGSNGYIEPTGLVLFSKYKGKVWQIREIEDDFFFFLKKKKENAGWIMMIF